MTSNERFEQRLSNFSKTLNLLIKSCETKIEDERDMAGIIQFFEMSVELSWKCYRDYMLDQDFEDPISPKNTVKSALNYSLISEENAEVWLKALNLRNITSHTYDENVILLIVNRIKDEFLPFLKKIHSFLS